MICLFLEKKINSKMTVEDNKFPYENKIYKILRTIVKFGIKKISKINK